MKSILSIFLITFIFSGCQDDSKKHVMMLNKPQKNTNLIHTRLQDKEQERKNKVQLFKIESQTKIELEKIKSQNKLEIAKVGADTKKIVVQTDSKTKIKTAELDSLTKKEKMEFELYITLIIIVVVVIALFLFYLNSKKSRDLKNKLQQEKLEHERILKEREFEEKRLHKVLDLVGNGKLSPELQEEILLTLSKPQHAKDKVVTLLEE